MPRYVATLRALYNAEDDAQAAFIADQIRLNGSSDFDEDDDFLDVTQVTSNDLDLTPEETITQLKKARNLLIKTRIRQCYALAKELDYQIFALIHRESPDFMMSTYDHGAFMDIADQILNLRTMPDV